MKGGGSYGKGSIVPGFKPSFGHIQGQLIESLKGSTGKQQNFKINPTMDRKPVEGELHQ